MIDNTHNFYIITLMFLISIGSVSCSREKVEQSFPNNKKEPAESEIREIHLKGVASERFVEASGLSWYKDYLIILPQFPHKIADSRDGALLAVSKQLIVEYLNNPEAEPITAELISFSANGIDELGKSAGAGYEAITFINDKVYMSIESYDHEKYSSYLVEGKVYGEIDSIAMDARSIVPIVSNSGLKNMGEEAIVSFDNRIIAIHEANGRNNTQKNIAAIYNPVEQTLSNCQFPLIEYRITDASQADSSGNFWVINYFYPGESDKLRPEKDYYADRFGVGTTNKMFEPIERLIELKLTEDRIVYTESPPVYIKLNDENGRNWEGLVKLDGHGFLLITDYYPRSLLAFIPYRFD